MLRTVRNSAAKAASGPWKPRSECREFAELFEAGIDLRGFQRAESLHAETFAAEASHDGPVDHGAAQLASADVIAFQIETLLRQIADKAAGKAISRTGLIEDVFEQIAGHHEHRIVPEQHRAIFAALDHQSVRPHVQNRPRGLRS